MLNTVPYPAESPSAAPPLLVAHGLFGSARNWGVICRRLSTNRRVIGVDMRNHGESPWTDTHRYPGMAEDLAEVIAAQGGVADVMGHSMGGKAAMVLALTRPDLVRRLVVVDIAPVGYSHDHSRNIEAMQGLDLTGLASRSEADRRLAETLPDAGLRAFFLQSLDLRADPPCWRLNLDLLAAEMAHIVGWPGTGGRFDRPALFLSAETSDYVLSEHREAILRLFPVARFVEMKGAGHWLHAEQPRAFEDTVRAFLDAA